eukprot:Opistho-2@87908
MTDAILHARDYTNAVKIIAHAPVSHKYLCCIRLANCGNIFSWCGGCVDLHKRTYMTVYENKVEYNVPSMICCCYYDNVATLYLDRGIVSRVGRAGFCAPACTHCSCFPTCCDLCGEGVVFYGSQCGSCKTAYECYYGGMAGCCHWFMFCGLDSADAVIAAVTAQWAVAVSRKAAPTQQLMMPSQQQQTTVVIQQPMYNQGYAPSQGAYPPAPGPYPQ